MALVFVSCFLVLLHAFSSCASFFSRAEADAIKADSFYYARLDAKHSLYSSMHHGAASVPAGLISRDEVSLAVTRKLAALDAFYSNKGGFSFWCGMVSSADLAELKSRISLARTPVRCANCWGFTDVSVSSASSNPVATCSLLLDLSPDGSLVISSNSLPASQEPGLRGLWLSGKRAVFGFSYYDAETNSSAVEIIPEGEVVFFG